MTESTPIDDWLKPFVEMVSEENGEGAFALGLPEYRPDLAQNIAKVMNLEFFDYRVEVMSELGWGARTLELDDLYKALVERAEKNGFVAFNVESLLATKSDDARAAWLRNFLDTPYPNTVVAPLCIFGEEVLASHPRFYRVSPENLPVQTFTNRLAM